MNDGSPTDQDIIDEAAAAHVAGGLISDLQARVIASAWHGGQGSALLSLSTTGAIHDGGGPHYPVSTAEEIEARIAYALNEPQSASDVDSLKGLLAYVRQCGPRGPADGWGSLSW